MWPGSGELEHRQTPVPTCRCEVCGRSCRVLPVEIVPHKTYTRMVIGTACATYVDANRPKESLRQTVVRMGKGHPHRSSLHGWLGGLGARSLGRLDKHGFGPPVAALIVESESRLRHDLTSYWTQPRQISTYKYRSLARRERLEACLRLFEVARLLFPQVAYHWFEWERWLQSLFHVTTWGFPSRFSCTAIQQPVPRHVALPCAPSSQQPRRRKKGHVHDARSPP
jgi:hypothetical protein